MGLSYSLEIYNKISGFLKGAFLAPQIIVIEKHPQARDIYVETINLRHQIIYRALCAVSAVKMA